MRACYQCGQTITTKCPYILVGTVSPTGVRGSFRVCSQACATALRERLARDGWKIGGTLESSPPPRPGIGATDAQAVDGTTPWKSLDEVYAEHMHKT